MTYSLDLEQIRSLAAARHDEFEVMRYRLELDDDLDDASLDAWVDRIAAPIISAIDCTKCGNCCRSLDVYLTPEDVVRLSEGLIIPVDAVDTVYVEHQAAAAEGEWGRFTARPCAFLRGTLCIVYPWRPDSCRTYPVFTPDFRWMLADTIGGASICPIIYHVLDRICAEVEAGITRQLTTSSPAHPQDESAA